MACDRWQKQPRPTKTQCSQYKLQECGLVRRIALQPPKSKRTSSIQNYGETFSSPRFLSEPIRNTTSPGILAALVFDIWPPLWFFSRHNRQSKRHASHVKVCRQGLSSGLEYGIGQGSHTHVIEPMKPSGAFHVLRLVDCINIKTKRAVGHHRLIVHLLPSWVARMSAKKTHGSPSKSPSIRPPATEARPGSHLFDFVDGGYLLLCCLDGPSRPAKTGATISEAENQRWNFSWFHPRGVCRRHIPHPPVILRVLPPSMFRPRPPSPFVGGVENWWLVPTFGGAMGNDSSMRFPVQLTPPHRRWSERTASERGKRRWPFRGTRMHTCPGRSTPPTPRPPAPLGCAEPRPSGSKLSAPPVEDMRGKERVGVEWGRTDVAPCRARKTAPFSGVRAVRRGPTRSPILFVSSEWRVWGKCEPVRAEVRHWWW